MSNYAFKIDTNGVKKEILQAEWMKAYIEEEARKKTTSNQHIKTFIGFDRAKSIIYPNTKEHKG